MMNCLSGDLLRMRIFYQFKKDCLADFIPANYTGNKEEGCLNSPYQKHNIVHNLLKLKKGGQGDPRRKLGRKGSCQKGRPGGHSLIKNLWGET